MSLYETLDLTPDPPPDSAAIKRAYKKKAKQTHPDAGGKPGEFNKVHRAYLVLSDPIRRAKYDQTGDIPEITPETAPLNLLVQFFVTIVAMHLAGNGQDPSKVDLIKVAREQFRKDILDAENNQVKLRRQMKVWQDIAKRFKSKKPADVLVRSLEAQVKPLEDQLRLFDEQIQIRKDATKLLDGYRFEFDAPDVGIQRAGDFINKPLWLR